MTYRFSHTLIFYTFLVVMFLLRPFMSYQLSINGVYANEHDHLIGMFQRVAKKKETHADDASEAECSTQAPDIEFILPFILVVLLRQQAAWLLSLLSDAKVNWRRNTIFQVCPSNHYYQFISRFQI